MRKKKKIKKKCEQKNTEKLKHISKDGDTNRSRARGTAFIILLLFNIIFNSLSLSPALSVPACVLICPTIIIILLRLRLFPRPAVAPSGRAPGTPSGTRLRSVVGPAAAVHDGRARLICHQHHLRPSSSARELEPQQHGHVRSIATVQYIRVIGTTDEWEKKNKKKKKQANSDIILYSVIIIL